MPREAMLAEAFRLQRSRRMNRGAVSRFVVQYRALQGGWKEKKLSGNDKLSGLGDTRVNNCTVVIFNYLILFS